jgi:hypothetical protein
MRIKETTLKKVVEVYFKVLCQYSHGETEVNQETSQNNW